MEMFSPEGVFFIFHCTEIPMNHIISRLFWTNQTNKFYICLHIDDSWGKQVGNLKFFHIIDIYKMAAIFHFFIMA